MDHRVDLLSRLTAENDSSDDQEESLSLIDLPLTPPRTSTAVDLPPPPTVNHSRRSSASDFLFEFLVNHDDFATSPADDVFFAGRLLPSAPPPPRRSLSLSAACRRSDSMLLNEAKPHQLTQPLIRPCRSLNYRKMRRKSTSKADLLPRNSSSSCRSYNSEHYKAGAGACGQKAPWYWLVFGLPARIPVEMELKDIKNRQFRRSNTPTAPFSGDRCSSASWRLLSVLSCKSPGNVDVIKTAPFHA